MRKLALLFIISVSISGCSSKVIQVGQVNMISNRNISNGSNYELLQKFSNSSTRQLERTRAKTINDAIDNVVKGTPGGEYLMNAKLYRVGEFFAAEGDVWGIAGQTDINGLKPNGIAYLKKRGGAKQVKVISFVDKDWINIQLENGKIIEVPRDKLVLASE